MQRKRKETMKILLANRKIEENTSPQIAHLQFERPNDQNQNCKRAIFLPNPQFQYIFEEIIKGI